jgi:polyhydroxyalkanoate synthesis repressor PhaR
MPMALIKRYSNRKLYDTQAKRYITLEGLGDLIRRGEEVRITDHETGEDITALILAQTVFELEKRVRSGLPGAVLTNLIRAGSDTLSQLRGAFTPEDSTGRVNAEIERRMLHLIQQGELDEEQGLRLLEKLIAAGESAPASGWIGTEVLERTLKQRGIPSRADVQALARRVEALSAELEGLSPTPAPKAPKSRPPRGKSTKRK